MTTTWRDASEMVAGLILKGRLSLNEVHPESFFGTYKDLIKLLKSGVIEPEELIARIGLSTYNTSLDAAKNITHSDNVNWVSMLEKSAGKYAVGTELEKMGRKLQYGDEIDPQKFNEIVSQLAEGGGEAKNEIAPIRGAEFLETAILPTPYIITGLWQGKKVSVISGDFGAYKTFIAMYLCVCVASGRDFLGRKVERVPVLYIDEEMDDEVMHLRFNAILAGMNLTSDDVRGYLFWRSGRRFNLLAQEDQNELEQDILVTGAKFILVDALSDIIPGKSPSDEVAMTELLLSIRPVATKRKCHIQFLHHFNKGGKYFGSVMIGAKPDDLWEVEAKQNKLTFKALKARHRQSSGFACEIFFENEKDELLRVWLETSEVEDDNKEKDLSEAETFLLNYIREHGNTYKTDLEHLPFINTDIGFTKKSIENAYYSLINKDLLERKDGGGKGSKALAGLKNPEGRNRTFLPDRNEWDDKFAEDD